MTSVLESRRRRELGGAVFQFLQSECPQVAEAYRDYAASKGTPVMAPTQTDQLYKKWSSTMRLQHKIDEQEKTISQLKEKLKLFENTSKYKSSHNSLPHGPPIEILTGHRQTIQRLAFHPLFLLLASCSDDGLILLWEYENGGTLVRTLRGHTAAVHDIDFDSTGKLLASCSSDTSVKLWDCSNFECLRTLNGHSLLVSCVRFLPGGEKLLSCSKDKSIRLWETQSGYCIRTFLGHTDWIRVLAIIPQGTHFASGGSDQTILFWNIEGQENSGPISQYIAHEHVIEFLVFANVAMLEVLRKGGKSLPSLASEEALKPRKRNTGRDSDNTSDATIDQLAQSIFGVGTPTETSNILDQVGPVLFSAARDKIIKMWDPMKGVCLQQFIGHLNWVKELAIHPGGLTIASCSDDKSIMVWDVVTGECVVTLASAHRMFVTCLRFGTISSVLVSGSMDKDIRLWECCNQQQSNQSDITNHTDNQIGRTST